MAMNFAAIGADNGTADVSWDHRDAIIYALGVGAGESDPASELHFTTENSEGVEQQVLPVFGVVQAMSKSRKPSFGDFHLSKVLHADQSFVVHRPLPAEGRARTRLTVTGIQDLGKAALVTSETTLTDAETGDPLITTRGGLFVRGEGGFGGEREKPAEWAVPDRTPDHRAQFRVRPELALLYRLSGDRNPLHSDPLFAQKAGFDRPILHGMATYGITCRLLVNALCGGDTTRVRGMYGRFSKPVLPGETLSIVIWVDGASARFQTSDAAGDVVLDRGTFDFEPAGTRR